MKKSERGFSLYAISEARNVLFGIATLWIGLFHSDQLMSALKLYTNNEFLLETVRLLKGVGNIGVDMFLLLSGIGLYFSYTKDRQVKNFWKKRLMRVLPTAFFIATFFFSFRYIIGRYDSGLVAYLKRMTFTNFFFHGERVFWFISLILVLYLVFPLFYKIIEKFRVGGMLVLVGAVVVFTFFLRWFAVNRYCDVEVGLWRVPIFIIGIWAGKFVMEKKKISRHWLWLFLAVGIAALVLMCNYGAVIKALIPDYTSKMENKYIWVYRVPGTILAGCLVVLDSFVITAIRRKGWCNVLRNFFEFVGLYSMEYYMIYLNINHALERVYHIPPQYMFMLYFGNCIFSLALCVVVRKVCDEFMAYMQRKPKDWDKIKNNNKKKTV